MVTDDNYPPYLFRDADGRLQGIVKDKWELWSARTGVAVKLDGMEWSKAQQSVGPAGSADVIDVFSPTEARARFHEFSPPWGKFESRVFFHRSISGVNDARSLRGFTVGTKEASSCTLWLRQNRIEPVRSYRDSEALVRAAGAGEVRLFCMDVPAAQYYLFKHRLADDFRQTPPINAANLVWAVAKGRTGLRDFIQGGFERISAAELQEIDERWMGNPVRLPIQPRYFLYAAAVAATLLAFALLMVLWNRALSRRVAERTAQVNGQKEVLELIAAGPGLTASLEALLRNIEQAAPRMLCSILLLDDDGKRLRHAAAPSLPAEYCRAIDGEPIGPAAGSCGTAAFRGAQVIVEDIQSDPLWKDYRELAAAHGLRACWSTPILDPEQRVIGTFALYFREPARPHVAHQQLISTATHLAAIAITKAKGEQERGKLLHDLGERVKELAALHAAARLFQSERSLDRGLLVELVGLLPPGWQYPDICVARIVYGDMEERSRGWRDTQWRQSARFDTGDGTAGLIEVAYLEQRPPEVEGPFLAEERRLIDSLAELVGEHFERIRTQTALRESDRELRLRAIALRSLSQRLMEVEEIERRNINRELHDSIAQNLSALQVGLVTLRMELAAGASGAAHARIDDAHALLEDTSSKVRDVMADLRPAALDDFGLLAALRDHCATFSARSGVVVTVLGRDPAPRPPLAAETALFRIAQEALNNVSKHAGAGKVEVKLDAGPEVLRLTISDNGTGFDAARPPQRAAHYGIATMRERAEAVGASLRIESAPGKGTRVEVELLRAATAAAA